MRRSEPPRFRAWRPPKAPSLAKADDLRRGSPRDRGIDSRLDRMSVRFRKANPFCRFCEQNGRSGIPARVMDHKLPRREFPQLAYEWSNCQPLCSDCDAIKQAMENFARANGLVDKLAIWCDSPESRPRQFRPGDVK